MVLMKTGSASIPYTNETAMKYAYVELGKHTSMKHGKIRLGSIHVKNVHTLLLDKGLPKTLALLKLWVTDK